MGKRAKRKITSLDLRRADFFLLIYLLERVPDDEALEQRVSQEC